MRGTACSKPLLSKLWPIQSSKGRWVGTITPKKQKNVEAGEARVKKENAEPIVAFSRPPPLSPFLGPLVALSMLDSWTKRDSGGDD